MTDDADAFTVEAAEAADNGIVVAEFAVTGKWHEIADEPGNVVEAMWSLRMPRNLSFLPRREFRIELLQRQRSLHLEPGNFLTDGDRSVAFAHRTQFFDLGLQFGHRFFEVEIAAHWVRAIGVFRGEVTRASPLSQAKRVNFAFTPALG